MSAWSSEHGLVLGQQKVDSKSNEITAVPLVLKLLNLKGAVVTLDAMGTQLEIAAQIKKAEGDYVLALKGNQGKLSQQVSDWFNQAIAKNWQGIEFSYYETLESGHHRSRNSSDLGSISESITTIASATAVAGLNHRRDDIE